MSGARIDLLCLAPHTDDAEIGLGGTLRLLAERGRQVWVVDLTRGELGSNGTPDGRWAEAARASTLLGLAGRLQGELPDGFVSPENPEHVAVVVAAIRMLRPRWIVTAPAPVRHPDHLATPRLVARALFLAHLAAYRPPVPAGRAWRDAWPTGDPAEPWRCEALFEVCPPGQPPDLLFDVSATWEAKLAALDCYGSQFRAVPGGRRTVINDRAFLDEVDRWALRWGFLAGVARAEALRTAAAPVLDDLPRERWA
ncbi:MAG: PIG-L family deacetylase [Candidatus Krumholzibacteriia bacterium]